MRSYAKDFNLENENAVKEILKVGKK